MQKNSNEFTYEYFAFETLLETYLMVDGALLRYGLSIQRLKLDIHQRCHEGVVKGIMLFSIRQIEIAHNCSES